jgi:hypothetical protein
MTNNTKSLTLNYFYKKEVMLPRKRNPREFWFYGEQTKEVPVVEALHVATQYYNHLRQKDFFLFGGNFYQTYQPKRDQFLHSYDITREQQDTEYKLDCEEATNYKQTYNAPEIEVQNILENLIFDQTTQQFLRKLEGELVISADHYLTLVKPEQVIDCLYYSLSDYKTLGLENEKVIINCDPISIRNYTEEYITYLHKTYQEKIDKYSKELQRQIVNANIQLTKELADLVKQKKLDKIQDLFDYKDYPLRTQIENITGYL